MQALAPARLAFAADGTPVSEQFGDVYHSAAGGAAQARHVFLQGNQLPERWRGRRSFTILETGFGLGLNFLTTLQAWRDDPQRCLRLHFVSIEKYPVRASDLADKELARKYPMLVPGVHRIEFGNVILTLVFADIQVVRDLTLAADALYLDGFAPAKNPEMWTPQVMRALSRLAAPGATAATWSVAADVRHALERTGFAVEKRAGFGGKREMLVARILKGIETREPRDRKAMVIGAGVAGAAVSERLTARGWDVTVIERHGAPAEEASGNHAGIFHPLLSPDDSVFARLTRASFLFLLQKWPELKELSWSQCGVLQRARHAKELASQQRSLEGCPPEYAQAREDGLWFPHAGWVRPRSLVNSLLKGNVIFGREVFSLDNGVAKDKDGKVIASAPVVILANAADAVRLAPQKHVRLRQVRGQLTHLPPIAGLEHVVLRGGMALPAIDGVSVVGASYDLGDPDPRPRAESHAGNLERLEQMLPGAARGLDPAKLEGRVAFRAVVPDRLPMIGAMGDGLYGAFAYGSRGLLWSGLGAELLASLIEGEPLPLEKKLVAALDPERFLLREKRKQSTGARA
jgi:tRNA 5-methylaminomethyl-2-thiouridine biosynthesis bifunctional protein